MVKGKDIQQPYILQNDSGSLSWAQACRRRGNRKKDELSTDHAAVTQAPASDPCGGCVRIRRISFERASIVGSAHAATKGSGAPYEA